MDVDLTLESERFAGTSVVRAFFLRDNRETHVYNETLTMNQPTDPQLKCTDVTAYLIVSPRYLLLLQRWTWVHFSLPNPAQPINLWTQPNPRC